MKTMPFAPTTRRRILILAVIVFSIMFRGIASGQQGSTPPPLANFGSGKRVGPIDGIDVPFKPGPFDAQGKVRPVHPNTPARTAPRRMTEQGLAGKARASQGKSQPTGARQIYSQVRSSAGTLATTFAGTASPLAIEFPGIHETDTTIPPDVGMAAGPVNVVAVSNSVINIYDKSGNLLSSETLATLFSPLGTVATQDGIFDPKVVYDPYIGRFWLYTVSENDALFRSTMLIGISNSDDLSAGWWIYALDATLDGATPTNNWCDYPQVGFDAQAVYFSCNMFSLPSAAPTSTFQGSKIRILLKSELINHNANVWYDFFNLTNAGDLSFTVAPAIMHSAATLDGEYLVNAQGAGAAGNALSVWHITNVQNCCNGSALGPDLAGALVPVGPFNTPPAAQQSGGATPVDTGDTRLLFSTWQDGHLSTGRNDNCNNGGVNSSCATFDELDVTNFPTVGVINDWALTSTDPGVAYYYPAVEQNANGDKAMVYSRSGPAEFVGTDFVGIPNSNTCTYCLDGAESTLAPGAGPYVRIDPTSNLNRWGDYFSASADPDGVGIWIAGEFANANNTWNTEIGLTFESQGPTFPLNVNLAGTGSGNVVSAPAGIVCPALCADTFAGGTLVTLIATPASGSAFAGWGGACTGTGGCVVAMNATQSVTATFNKSGFALNVSLAGTGSGSVSSSPAGISCPSTCTGTYFSGTVVTLTATPASGSTFAGWSGACTGTGSCSLSMTTSKSVTATFNKPSFSLSVTLAGTGKGTATSSPAGISCPSTCTANYNSGASVTLMALPAHGSKFAGWSGSCAGTGSCIISMTASRTVTATFTAVPVVGLSPSVLSFGGQLINSTSGAKTAILTNGGGAPLNISSIVASGDYSVSHNCPVSPSTLAAGSSCSITVTFTPTVPGLVPGEVTITDNAGGSPHLVNLTGTGLTPITFSPASLSFGTLNVGTTSAPKTVTISNNLTTTLTIGFGTSGDYSAVASGTTPCASTLAAKTSCAISVSFRPTMSGVVNGAVTVKYSGSFSPVEVTLLGTGNGGSTAPLSFSPASLTFMNIPVGTTSAGQTVTVTNTSTSAVSISNLAASGSYNIAGSGTVPCAGTLSAGAKCTFAVSFSPTINGVIKGAVTITDNSALNPQVYNLSGTAVLPVRFSPASLSFGTLNVGTTSAPQTVTLINAENAALTINSIVASGQFKVTPGMATPCGSNLPALGQCTFSVTFTPQAASSISGVVTVNYGGGFSPVELQLSGTAH